MHVCTGAGGGGGGGGGNKHAVWVFTIQNVDCCN